MKHTIKKPDLAAARSAIGKRLSRRKGLPDTLSNVPRITNETVAEHREAVLKGARKYIYPLQHSRDRIIKISIALFVAAVLGFFAYCTLALYKLQSRSTFLYEVTRVIPFPVAKAGSRWVSYESYLFELRHLTHYYETQQQENYADPRFAEHLDQLKRQSLQKVIDDAYVKELADRANITVTNRQVADQIALVKAQNRLGSSDQMLEDVLKQFWGWSIEDFQRELKSQLLSQKVASSADGPTHARASNALAELRAGADFAAIAAKYSDDTLTKDKGGQYGGPIGKTDRDAPPAVVDALYRLPVSQVSDIIDTGYNLEILKNLGANGDKLNAAHIQFKLKPIQDQLKPLEAKSKISRYIKV